MPYEPQFKPIDQEIVVNQTANVISIKSEELILQQQGRAINESRPRGL
jgi:hypothetical protein